MYLPAADHVSDFTFDIYCSVRPFAIGRDNPRSFLPKWIVPVVNPFSSGIGVGRLTVRPNCLLVDSPIWDH